MAGNRAFPEGRRLAVAVASTVKSGDPVLINEMGGVALTDYDSVSGKASIDFSGVYSLSVKGVNDGGNVAVAVGDALYFVSGDTPVLSKKSSGVFFGYALEVVNSGATTTIKVRVRGAGRLGAGYFGSGIFVSSQLTGTGSSQTTAHGLGVVPSRVVLVPTGWTSGQTVSLAEGTHTTTAVVTTVTNAVTYKIIAFK